MKRILFLLTMSFSAFLVKAQKYDVIKNQLILNKFKEARVELDKEMSNAKFNSKAEAYILKTAIYAGLSMEEGVKGTPAGDQLAVEADLAFKKYKEMDPSLALVSDLIYKNGPINVYSNYYTSGYNDYTGKKWQTSYEKFKKAVEYSDMLIDKKLFGATLDTNVLILAGLTAEYSNHKEDAIKFYSRLADHKVTGEGFESVYRVLVGHYYGKKDMVAFEKYKALGKELYPKSDFFGFDKLDFAVGLEENWNDKIKAIELVLVTDPNNLKANDLLWGLIYDTLNATKVGSVLPANAAELEKKMIDAINKVVSVKPDSETPFVFLGSHFINKKEKINDARAAHTEDMKARTKPGTMSSKEDLAKRDLLDKQYFDAMEAIAGPYEQAAKIFAAKTTALDAKQKQQYRNIAGYLSEIYELKKKRAKAKSPEQIRFEAEEKKWFALYESIK